MPWIFFLLFVGFPIAEIAVLISAGEAIGLWPTIFLIILTAGVGASLARAEGRAAMQRLAAANSANAALALVDAAAIFIGAIFLLTPGFITDALGLSLVFRPTRLLWAHVFVRFWQRRRGNEFEDIIIEGDFSEKSDPRSETDRNSHQLKKNLDDQ
ncbi:MAG: FxsA family protein [Rhodospirillales bacterium]|jgi:UPF0716 protein FxsA